MLNASAALSGNLKSGTARTDNSEDFGKSPYFTLYLLQLKHGNESISTAPTLLSSPNPYIHII